MRTFFLEGRFGMFPTALFGFLAVAVALMCALRPDERRHGIARHLATLTLLAGLLWTTACATRWSNTCRAAPTACGASCG